MVELILKGVGFKAFVNQKRLYLQLGYSHYISIDIPLTVTVKAKKNRIITDNQQFSNIIQKVKLPDPYKATGIQFKNKIYKLKQGKKR